jgi:AcrR family transcriptional regulator
MPRPITIQDNVILQAARELFLARGLRATTAEIAERAQVSPGILFKRFKTKEALFRAAMAAQSDTDPPLPIDLALRIGSGRVDETLIELGTLLLERFIRDLPTMMMDWSSMPTDADNHRARPDDRVPERVSNQMQVVADYLAAEAQLGRISADDCEVVAQTFIGSLWHQAFIQVMLKDRQALAQTHRAYVGRMVYALWSGIAPH